MLGLRGSPLSKDIRLVLQFRASPASISPETDELSSQADELLSVVTLQTCQETPWQMR